MQRNRTRFRPQLPGRGHSFRAEDNRYDSSRVPLVAHPSDDRVSLHELLPTSTQMPVPFEATDLRVANWFSCSGRYVEEERLSGESVLVIYAPGGDIGTQGVHIACRLTHVGDDESTDNIAAHHRQSVWEAFDGDPERDIYSDWVTSELKRQTVAGHERTVHRLRRPRLVAESMQAPVSYPVIETAFAVQSTTWGLIEVGAYLTPDPTDGEARELVQTVTDTVTKANQRHGPPLPME